MDSNLEDMTRLITQQSQRAPLRPIRNRLEACPLIHTNGQAFYDRVHGVMSRCGIHQHHPTCHHPPGGKCGCRFAFPKECQDDTTVVELLPGLPENMNIAHANEKDISAIVVPQEHIKPKKMCYDRTKTTYFDNPLPLLDSRLLVWELKRPRHDFSDLAFSERFVHITFSNKHLNLIKHRNI